ncbi:MAG: NAD(P)-dependent oxidoreductase [Thermogemmatispora sp.]|uniref:3-hydroxyisobutyrate dehydrogenase n=1 Tax=Thermogemmatispora aurantia TaxID=2045279 RepID=A0A5J4K874_9CHLR|nr:MULTISPECIES: NAD(P)-dependent oxidoreductase [Thermogemmatispora]MBE3566142.1 NAD(P)-dependent oxidoreductase [Thermogemmatispora sp.]GER82881.1 3-hydroxyisobutyrate dehydrogenase [Thermogemmatispora aurantia]
MANLGFVGLGAMGGRIAYRLLQAGHTLTGYNRTREKARWLLEAGMRWGESPAAVAQAADITFSMVADTAALQAITEGPQGLLAGLGPGKIYVDMSTVSPSVSRALAARVAERGAHMLDAPVSGSTVTVEQGRLAIMVGGDQAVFEQVRPVLLDIGPKVNYVGPNGQAVLMKIAINLSLPVQFLAFSEGLLLAEKGGIPRETAFRVWMESVVASPAMQYRGPFVLERPAEALFSVTMMQKDLLLAQELGREVDVPLPSVALTNELLTAARALGLGREDFAVLFDVLAHMAGVPGSPSADQQPSSGGQDEAGATRPEQG